jgi:hypothetical protein
MYRQLLSEYFLSLLVVAGCMSHGVCAAETNDPSSVENVRFKKIQLSDQFSCEGATCADINGDGHKDFIAGHHLFEGPSFAEPHAYRPGEPRDIDGYSDNFFTFAHDFNEGG